MRIASIPHIATSTPTTALPRPATSLTWTNPAAAAALHSTADMLTTIESGIVRNFGNAAAVRSYATDLLSTVDIIATASEAITSDTSKENDAFLPLITNAGGNASHAGTRLQAKELATTWPVERGDILQAVRRARAISLNVANQLDPRSARDPR